MEKTNHKVAAVVVTYNRSQQLQECIQAILAQTVLPDYLIIADNHSTDQTLETLVKHKLLASVAPEVHPAGKIYRDSYHREEKEMQIHYIYKDVNDGGAGGFYAGMVEGSNAGCGWIWMMDDDGVPKENQLEELLSQCQTHDIYYSNALVLQIDDPRYLSFPLRQTRDASGFMDMELLEGEISPFNGTFIASEVIEKIGYVKREMFIYGDELEYTSRVIAAGFKIFTLCTAIHYHPRSKANRLPVFPFIASITYAVPPPKMAAHFYRNRGYIHSRYKSFATHLKFILVYTSMYITNGKFSELSKLYKYYRKGCRNDYTGD